MNEKYDLCEALKEAKQFAIWVECLGRTDCEIYKHELRASGLLAIERIDKALDRFEESKKVASFDEGKRNHAKCKCPYCQGIEMEAAA